MSKKNLAILVLVLVLVVDQASKIWIKTHMSLGQEFHVFDWFRIHFVENNGMAYGMELGGRLGKIALSLFRVVAVFFIGRYIYKLIKKDEVTKGLVICLTLILAGAIGNIIDSMFYGLCFSASYFGTVAQYMGFGNGYESFLHGKVVDMLYFALINTYLPDSMPIVGGKHFVFFRPVFNVADSAVTVGVASLLLFYRGFFDKKEE